MIAWLEAHPATPAPVTSPEPRVAAALDRLYAEVLELLRA